MTGNRSGAVRSCPARRCDVVAALRQAQARKAHQYDTKIAQVRAKKQAGRLFYDDLPAALTAADL